MTKPRRTFVCVKCESEEVTVKFMGAYIHRRTGEHFTEKLNCRCNRCGFIWYEGVTVLGSAFPTSSEK